MVRSRSRSPRWKRRSLSPVFRAQEYNRQRHYHIDYDSEYKIFQKDSKKLISWRMKEAKHGQTNPRYIPHETNYHRLHESRSYSPTLKRNPSEDIDNHKSFRTYSPEKNESIRRNQFSSRYLEISHKEHHQSFYPSKVHVREMYEDTRAVGNTKEMKTYHRPLKTLCKFERKWNENYLRHHQLQEDKYVQSSRRFSNECTPRSSSKKRYPDRDYREYGSSSKKVNEMERGASGHITERQTSCDLVAVGKKPESFHPVFEHIKSVTQKVEQNPSKEFAQEIITIIHQVKANYFKSSDLTLNERFSKIQDISGANEVKRHLDPEIHRRIDMSLAELQNKRAISCESGQNVVRVLEDPNDLRHDIERRRKQRLENEDENVFYINIPQRHAQNSSFVKLRNVPTYKYQKSPRFPSQPFRKFIKKPYMSHCTADITTNRFKRRIENPETVQRPIKYSFIDGRPHFRSNLVQKGLYIQAKYQRLRYAGAKGGTTYKIREEL
uniref:BCLAF1 and THRAP3 family member 3 n=1 Tax=Micrurus corallinus TaxID=54390 RepID=A0A2D4H4C6_MICCO